MRTFPGACLLTLLTLLAAQAHAALPVPSEEARAAAAAAKDKQAWTDKVNAYKVCLAQDKVAAYYFKHKGEGGKASMDLPACTDPGPYVAQIAAAREVGIADSKPVPAAGAPQPAPIRK